MIYSGEEILSNGKYRVNRRIPVVQDPEPKDYAKALSLVKYLREGRTILIKGIKTTTYIGIDKDLKTGLPIKRKFEQRWYKIKGGYIKEIALLGAEIKQL